MDADLLSLFNKGTSIKDLATKHFFRTENAIRLRLQHLGYYMEVDKDMSKAPNRYLVLGVRRGHVARLASRRGYTSEEVVAQALLGDDLVARSPGGKNDCLILVTIRAADDDIGKPLHTDVQVIEREEPVPPYHLRTLYNQKKEGR